MARQWFSVAAVVATITLMLATDSVQAQERRFRRWARGYSDNVVMPWANPGGGWYGRFGPRYMGYPETPVVAVSQTEMRQSFYTGRPAPVVVTLRVPPQADILFDSAKTIQKGALRTYISPPINPERAYTYQVTAKWMEDGKERTETRNVEVRAGDQLVVDLTKPTTEKDQQKN